MQHEWGEVIGVGVHIYMYVCIYICGPKKINRTLAINLTFQTLSVDFSSILWISSTTACSRNAFLNLFNAHLDLFVRRMT